MNKIIQFPRRILTTIVLSFMSFLAIAQDKGVDIDVSLKKESEWYQQPWVWIVGGAVFIIIIVALLRGGGKKE
jgi:hypothetical protein